MNNYPEIADLLLKIAAIAEKHKLADVERVVTVECEHEMGYDLTAFWPGGSCLSCHGTGRVLRDMGDWPDGALAGAWMRLYFDTAEDWDVDFDSGCKAINETDDLAMTQALLAAMEATYA